MMNEMKCTADACLLKMLSEGSWVCQPWMNEVVAGLLDEGANINARNQHGQTPLFCALETLISETLYQETDKVLCLLECGADVNLCDITGVAPLHLATHRWSIEVMAALLDKGADIEVKDCLGRTPLFYACCLDKVEFLVEKGANVNVRTKHGLSLLHHAAELLDVEMMAYFLDKGIDIESCDDKGNTPLFHALLSDWTGFTHEHESDFFGDGLLAAYFDNGMGVNAKTDAVKFFLDRGANVQVRNRAGESPLDLARRDEQEDIVGLLLRYWAETQR
jgi:ankyrin repeat protein